VTQTAESCETVLDLTSDQVAYISHHAFYDEKDGDLPDFLASSTPSPLMTPRRASCPCS
jgi:hypothetical protein